VFKVTYLFKFWETNDNVSLTVHDRDIVVIEDYEEIICGPSNGIVANARE